MNRAISEVAVAMMDFIEKYVSPRHIEIQVMADSHGKLFCIYLKRMQHSASLHQK
jgi:acetyl/propionyl-CoA carboxylase alpha subunit